MDAFPSATLVSQLFEWLYGHWKTVRQALVCNHQFPQPGEKHDH